MLRMSPPSLQHPQMTTIHKHNLHPHHQRFIFEITTVSRDACFKNDKLVVACTFVSLTNCSFYTHKSVLNQLKTFSFRKIPLKF